MRIARIVAVVIACLVAALPVQSARAESTRAPDLPEVITLQRALELLEKSPRSLAERAQVDVAAAEREGARVLPNPSLSYGGLALAHGANVGPAWEHEIVVEQPLLLFGQRDARKNAAELGTRAERARVTASLAERALEVRRAFATLLARQERLAVLEAGVEELSRLERIVRGRQEAGDRSLYDVARIELETTGLRVELHKARTEVRDASGRLASLLGFPGWQPRAEGSLEPETLPSHLQQLWDAAQRRRPSIAAARARLAAARGGLRLARRESLPVPAVALGTLLTQREDSAAVLFGFSMPVPIFDRGQGAIARAEAEVRAGERAVAAELAESRAELERAHAVFSQEKETLRLVEEQMVDRIPALQRMAEEAYRGGSTGILELLDSFRSVQEIRLTHLAQREAVKLAEADLIAAAGL